MRSIHILQSVVAVSLLLALPGLGQQQKPVSERTEASVRGVRAAEPETPATSSVPAQGNPALGPRLVKFSGVLTEFVRNSASSSVEMTFALYKDEVGGEALWTETQSVEVDKEGRYTVLLGAAQADGVPVELFPAGEPRWLGVEIRGQAPQSRTLLVSVPYALKALDAEKLAGKSLSDFVLSEGLGDQVRRVMEGQNIVASQATSTGSTQPGQTKASTTSTAATSAAGPMFPPSTFSGTNATQIVQVTQNGSGNGLVASTPSSTGNSAVVGVASSNSTSNNQNGVIGFNAGAGSGVAGIATNPAAGVGIYGQSANFAGVFGNAITTTGFSNGIFGQTSSPEGSGVNGNNNATTGFARGVTGNSNSTNGVGVFGSNSATSGNAHGVFGLSNSPAGDGVVGASDAITGGAGVFGSANATSGGIGVFGQNISPDGAGVAGFANASSGGTGVAGFANASSGFNSGVFGQSASANGTGVFGSSFQWVGVGGQATAPSGGPAFGVWGDSLSTNGTGVAGFADATSGYTNGVMGTSVSPNGNGVLGVNNSNAPNGGSGVAGISNATSGGSSGVFGLTHSTSGAGTTGIATASSGYNNGVYGQNASNQGYAVHGDAIASSGPAIGVFGTSTAANGGTGVWGVALANSGGAAVGVRGDLESPTASGAAGLFLTLSPTSVAGQFANFSRQGLILQGLSGPFDATQKEVFRVDSSGNLHITGNLTVDGTKSSTAKLQDGREVALYAVESPENWFEDFGSSELQDGVAWVPLDPSFAQAVNAAATYHVFLTANGDSNGLYVARKTAAGFEIREHGGATSNVAFDYRIVARRRGFETIRMLQVPERKTLEVLPQHVELATSRPKEEPVKIPPISVTRITPPSTVRPTPRKVIVPQVPRPNVPQPRQPR